MFRIVCKSIHSVGTTSKPHKLNIFPLQEFTSSAINSKESMSKYVNQEASFTVRYLMNEIGFSLEKAVVASKRVHFENPDKPNAVVSFFKNQGLSHTQIRKVISTDSSVLVSKPENTLLPKIEYFRSKGFSSTDLAKMIVFNPNLMARSLKDFIVPSFDSLSDLIGCDQLVKVMLKQDSRLLNHVDNRVKSNIEILRGAGVNYSRIVFFFKSATTLFCYGSDKLKESIDQVQKLGLDPQSSSYRVALSVLTVIPRSKWNAKMEAYKRWGCSEDQVLTIFKISPWIMGLSEEKLNGVMSFFVNEMGLEASEIVRKYNLLSFSLRKRIVPRWSVYKELVSRKLVKEEVKLTALFKSREDVFLEKYVNCYKDEAPLLLKLYLEKLEASK